MSYYERWYVALVARLIDAKLITRAEVESGKPADRGASPVRAASATEAVNFVRANTSTRQSVELAQRFKIGQQVRAHNINPVTYTRLPRYARGRLGTIDRVRGVFPIVDVGGGGKPQNLYSVRFSAQELWGDKAAPQDAVYIDMWDDYLERA
jgi:nitrile hydratase